MPSAPHGMDRDGEHAGQGAQPEGDDEDQREDDLGNGAAEFEIAAHREAQPGGAAEIGGGGEAEQEGAGGAEDRADIGDEQGLPEQLQPAFQAPVPFGEVGTEAGEPERRQRLVDIFREAVDVLEEPGEIDLRAARRQEHAGDEDDDADQGLPALGRGGLPIGLGMSPDGRVVAVDREGHGEALPRGRGISWCRSRTRASFPGEAKRRPENLWREMPGSSPGMTEAAYDDFFLRRSSTNLFSSMIGS